MLNVRVGKSKTGSCFCCALKTNLTGAHLTAGMSVLLSHLVWVLTSVGLGTSPLFPIDREVVSYLGMFCSSFNIEREGKLSSLLLGWTGPFQRKQRNPLRTDPCEKCSSYLKAQRRQLPWTWMTHCSPVGSGSGCSRSES